MTKDQATKRPWVSTYLPEAGKQNPAVYQIDSESGLCIGRVYTGGAEANGSSSEANARLIVKAVNNFDLSLKAFNDILSSNNIEEIKNYARKMVQLLQDN